MERWPLPFILPYDTAPRYLIFDRDSIFSSAMVEIVKAMGTNPVRISYRSPWQNGTAERWKSLFFPKGFDTELPVSVIFGPCGPDLAFR
jgi:hypothetical protein